MHQQWFNLYLLVKINFVSIVVTHHLDYDKSENYNLILSLILRQERMSQRGDNFGDTFFKTMTSSFYLKTFENFYTSQNFEVVSDPDICSELVVSNCFKYGYPFIDGKPLLQKQKTRRN